MSQKDAEFCAMSNFKMTEKGDFEQKVYTAGKKKTEDNSPQMLSWCR